MGQATSTSPSSGQEGSGQFYSLIRPYRWQVILLCLMAIGSVCLSFAPHYFVWWLGDHILSHDKAPSNQALLIGCGLLVGALAARYSLAGATSIGSHFVAFQIQKDLRIRLSEKLSMTSMGFLEQQRRGDLGKLAVDDVESLEDGFAHLIPELAACLVSPVLLISVMLTFDGRMTFAALSPIALSFLVLIFLVRKGEKATKRYQESLSEVGSAVDEVISAFPLVKTHNAESILLGKAERAFKAFRQETADWIRQALVPSVWFQVLTTSSPITVLSAGIYFHQEGSLSLSSLLLFLILSINLGNLFSTLGSLGHRLSSQKEVLDRIFSILDEPSLPQPNSEKTTTGHSIVFEDVGFSYDGSPTLQSISLSVEEGASVALVGPSGSGKSTVLRLISRFWDIQRGTLRIGGTDIRNLPSEHLNRLVSVTFQDVFLFSHSIADNIRLGHPEATDETIIRAAKAAQAHDFIMDMPQGYQTVLKEGGHNLSGGQRQRLSIARSILHDTPILLLDEATAYADPQNEKLVQQAISELARNKTVLMVAHRLNTVVNMDKIIVLEAGRIIDQGTHLELLDRCPLYQQMWRDHLGSQSFKLGDHQKGAG